MKRGTHKFATEYLEGKQKPEVVSYLRKLSHGLKKVLNRFNVSVVFSAYKELTQLSRRMSCADSNEGCQKNRTKRFVECAKNVYTRFSGAMAKSTSVKLGVVLLRD